MTSILIKNGHIVTMDGALTVHESGWVLVQDDVIRDVGRGECPETGLGCRVIDATDMVVMPGLVNSHTHLAQTLMRGSATRGPLQEWLNGAIRPLESAMTVADHELASRAGLIENLRHGVTAVIQHQKVVRQPEFVDASATAAIDIGMRMLLARGWRDRGRSAERPDDILRSLTTLYDKWHLAGDGLITVGFGPTAPHHCSEVVMRASAHLARTLQVPIHIHLSETSEEVAMLQRETGHRPIEWLSSANALDERTQLVHCVWLDDREIDLVAASRATVVHCPVSNLFLSSGIAPLGLLSRRGVRLAIGTDGAASNGTQDVLESAKLAILMSATFDSGAAVEPETVLRYLTTNAASLVNPVLQGTLAPSAKADIAVFALANLRATPAHSLMNAVLFGLSGREAHTVVIDGRIVLDAGKVLSVDEDALLRECHLASEALFKRAGLVDRGPRQRQAAVVSAVSVRR